VSPTPSFIFVAAFVAESTTTSFIFVAAVAKINLKFENQKNPVVLPMISPAFEAVSTMVSHTEEDFSTM
jgi:hypothetical protein